MKNIGILGSAFVGQTLARGFKTHGDDVRIGSRTPEKLTEFSSASGIPAATFGDVAKWADVIVLADHSSGASTAGRASPEKWQALTSVPAIRAGRLYSADLSILHRYGPRVSEGLEMLARMIHPEAFK